MRLMDPDVRNTWWNVKIWKLMEMILTVFRGFPPVIFHARNLARMGTNFERARRILGLTTRQTSSENLDVSVEERC